MSERATFERILRDEGDNSGQTIRQWSIVAEPGRITIRQGADGTYLLGMREEDVDMFMGDLQKARVYARATRPAPTSEPTDNA